MVQVTARLGDTTQSFQYEEAHYGDLIAILLELFGLPFDTKLVLKYEDDEGDMITVGSSTELHDATVVFPNNLTLEVIAYPGLQSPSSDLPAPLPSKTQELLDNSAPVAESAVRAPKRSGSGVLARPNSEFHVFANEFHYHRLLIQTAIADFFERMRRTSEEVDVRTAMQNSLRDLSNQFSSLPTPSQIGQLVATKLSELHAYTAPIVESIRLRVVSVLERFYQSVSNRLITFQDIETVAHQSVDEALQAVSSSSSSSAAASADALAMSSSSTEQQQQQQQQQQEQEQGSSSSNPTPFETPVVVQMDSIAADADEEEIEPAPTSMNDDAASVNIHTFDVVSRSEILSINSSVTTLVASEQLQQQQQPQEPQQVPVDEPVVPVQQHVQQQLQERKDEDEEDDFVFVDANEDVAATSSSAAAAAPRPATLMSSLIMPTISRSTLTSNEEAALKSSPYREKVVQMRNMGYTTETSVLMPLLEAHKGDLNAVVDELSHN